MPRSFYISLIFCLASSQSFAAPVCPIDKRADWQRSVVIAEADRAIFTIKSHLASADNPADFDFSFAATIEQILKSAGLKHDKAAQIASVKSLIDTFAATKFSPGPGREIDVPPRQAESKLDAAQLLDETSDEGMQPIGLFNRFDQAPDTWQYCGEHRIVYAQGKRQNDGSVAPLHGRFFLIFEAAVKNPRPDLAQEGCRPIAILWKSLAAPSTAQPADALKEIARKLHQFYYDGIKNSTNASLSIDPVIHIDHYGNPFGQVRANLFLEVPWELRQWRIDPATGSFIAMPVGTNPQPSLYSDPARR